MPRHLLHVLRFIPASTFLAYGEESSPDGCCCNGGQVGNVTEDELYWTRPENMNTPRPFYYVPVSQGTSDLLGSLIGAFASSAPLFRTLEPVYYNQLLSMAQALYGVMISALPPACQGLPHPVLLC